MRNNQRGLNQHLRFEVVPNHTHQRTKRDPLRTEATVWYCTTQGHEVELFSKDCGPDARLFAKPRDTSRLKCYLQEQVCTTHGRRSLRTYNTQVLDLTHEAIRLELRGYLQHYSWRAGSNPDSYYAYGTMKWGCLAFTKQVLRVRVARLSKVISINAYPGTIVDATLLAPISERFSYDIEVQQLPATSMIDHLLLFLSRLRLRMPQPTHSTTPE